MLLPYIIHNKQENGEYKGEPQIIYLDIHSSNTNAYYAITKELYKRKEILDNFYNELQQDGKDSRSEITSQIVNFSIRYDNCNSEEEFYREFEEELLRIPKIIKLTHNGFLQSGFNYGVYDILNRRHHRGI